MAATPEARAGLMEAATRGHSDVIDLLVAAGEDLLGLGEVPNQPYEERPTPINANLPEECKRQFLGHVSSYNAWLMKRGCQRTWTHILKS